MNSIKSKFLFVVFTISLAVSAYASQADLKKNEMHYLKNFSYLVERSGDNLILKTDVKPIVYKNNPNAGESSAKYYLVDVMLAGNAKYKYCIVQWTGWEAGGCLLVNMATGKEIRLRNYPIFFKPQGMFIENSFDIDAGYEKNEIIIYKHDGTDYNVEWKYGFEGMEGPHYVEWINSEKIIIITKKYSKQLEIEKDVYFLIKSGGKWGIHNIGKK